jgi:hypothetical protein
MRLIASVFLLFVFLSAARRNDAAVDAVPKLEGTAPNLEETAPAPEGSAREREEVAPKPEETVSKPEGTAPKRERPVPKPEGTASITEHPLPKLEGRTTHSFTTFPSGENPIDILPGHVEGLASKVTLFADYDNRCKDGTIVVYLINRSDKAVTLFTSGDTHLKLEVLDENGKWRRAQSHRYSGCAHCYKSYKLRPDHFRVMAGYQPQEGKRQKVRYSLYGQRIQPTSNAGMGIASAVDIEKASHDQMRVKTGDFEFVRDVALENQLQRYPGLRVTAIMALLSDKFEADKSEQVLAEVVRKSPSMAEPIKAMRWMVEHAVTIGKQE